jgi:hypothetical protein
MAQVTCDGPGPHIPSDGVLGTSTKPMTARCSSPACVPAPDPTVANADTLRQRAQAALTANAAYLALATPTATQTTVQVQRLTKENNALIRLALNLLSDISDTA